MRFTRKFERDLQQRAASAATQTWRDSAAYTPIKNIHLRYINTIRPSDFSSLFSFYQTSIPWEL